MFLCNYGQLSIYSAKCINTNYGPLGQFIVFIKSAVIAKKLVELFHLVFVRALFANVKDKSLLAVKGGINPRFFFQSVRFSEDLDLDVKTMSKAALENRVDRLLSSPTVISPLKARGIITNHPP